MSTTNVDSRKINLILKCWQYVGVIWAILKVYICGFYCLLLQTVMMHRHFDIKDVEDKNLVAIVTGGGRGIGAKITKCLASSSILVIIGARSKSESETLIKEIKVISPLAKVEFHELDLASVDSVRAFEKWFAAKNLPLHILINNAGVMFVPKHITEDGFEEHFAVNYLSHFLLTHLLLKNMCKSAGDSRRNARIINISSHVHYCTKPDYTRINDRSCYIPHEAYAQSKLAQVMFTYHMQALLKARKLPVQVYAVHPGVVNTQLYNNVHPLLHTLMNLVFKPFFKSARQGADTTLYLALSSEGEATGGLYYDNCQPTNSSTCSYDILAQYKLYELSCQAVNIDKDLIQSL